MWHQSNIQLQEDTTSSEFWIPYSDLMAGLLGVFALLLVTTLHSLGERISNVRDILEERKQVVEQLKLKFKNDARVELDTTTGTIRFRGDILFDRNQWDLRPEGKSVLSEVMPRYFDVLFGEEDLISQIEQVVVVGHADRTFNRRQYGDPEMAYKHNLDLSQKRAFSVMEYLLDDPLITNHRDRLKELGTATGRSFMDPVIDDETGIEDEDRSRRIEIRFRLKDHELLEQVLKAVFADTETTRE